MKNLIVLFILLLFTGCIDNSPSSTNTTTDTNSYVGYLVDDNVSGVEYKCGTITGITGDQKDEFGVNLSGSFQFRKDCTVEFNIGKIFLGSFPGEEVIDNADLVKDNKIFIFPTNLAGVSVVDTDNPKVVNILRFLQSLDTDDDPTNGIEINATVRENLNKRDVLSLDLTNSGVTQSDLNDTVIKADINKTLITATKAIAHFETTIRREVSDDIDTVAPAQPFLIEDLRAINTDHTKFKDIEVRGEAGAKIFVAFNSDGNISNLNFIDQNLTIDENGSQILRLDFDNDAITNFHYYIMLQDAKEHNSSFLHLNVLKDLVPPQVTRNEIIVGVKEGIEFIQEINATDDSGLVYYDIVEGIEDSPHADLFVINNIGELRFKDGRDFETIDDTVKDFKYYVVARARDQAGNMTDVQIVVELINTLDNAPQLIGNDFNISITEMYKPDTEFYNLTDIVDSNYTLYPDNNLSPFYYKLIDDPSGKFEIERDTGIVKIQSGKVFDFESFTDFLNIDNRTIDLNVSIENENNSSEGNVSYATLSVIIENIVDTSPTIIGGANTNVPERKLEYQSGAAIFTISIDYTASDKDPSMTFHFYYDGGYHTTSKDGNFTISNSGVISVIPFPNLDYEETKSYSLAVRARSYYDNNVDGDYNHTNNKQNHDSNEVTVDINITNIVDLAPVIVINESESNNSIPESIVEISAANPVVYKFDINGTEADENNVSGGYEILKIRKIANSLSTTLDAADYPFVINGNGELKPSKSFLPDNIYFENNNSIDTIYKIDIVANNIGWKSYAEPSGNLQSNTIPIEINVTNVIDNAPVLLTPSTTLSFEENISIPKPADGTAVGSSIYKIKINGTTTDEYNITSYQWAAGNESENNETFELNTTSGEITLAKLLNYEVKSSYSLKLLGSNIDYNGSELNSSTITLNIDVNNTIEKAPDLNSFADIYIHENISDGIIIQLIDLNSSAGADEKNVSENFSISSGNDGNFTLETISDTTGIYAYLKTVSNNKIDYEGKEARDGDGNITYVLEINATNEFGSTYENINVILEDDIESGTDLLILIVEFSDVNSSADITDVDNNIFTPLNRYLKTASKDSFIFSAANENYGDFGDLGSPNDGLIKVKLSQSHPKQNKNNLKNRIELALKAADGNITYSDYDDDGDGNLSKEELQILVLIAEDSNDSDKNILAEHEGSNYFDYNVTLDGVNIAYNPDENNDLKSDGNYVVIGETDNNETVTIGIIAKMLSEKLFGFIRGGTDYKFLEYGLMHTGYRGSENNDSIGTRPVHPTVFNKTKQGWVTPRVLTPGTHEIVFYNTHNDQNKFNTIRINTDDGNIYYLIENRNFTYDNYNDIPNPPEPNPVPNYDNGLKNLLGNDFDGGLIIWKINETANDESVNLVEISNSTYNIFRPNNDETDLPTEVRTYFEFVYETGASGDIDGDSEIDGSKTYTVKIEVK